MLQLCYNSWHPVEILTECVVRPSILDRRNRGVSFSENLGLWGHGPFKFIFKPERVWYEKFAPCEYGLPRRGPDEPFNDTRLVKPAFFADEQEWWCPGPVSFTLDDLERVVYMRDSPGQRIHPRICERRWRQLQQFAGKVQLSLDTRRYPPPKGDQDVAAALAG